MKARIDAVAPDSKRDEFTGRYLYRACSHSYDGAAGGLRDLLRMAVDDCRPERFLAGKVLVERTDADTRHLRDLVGACPIVPFAQQNASSCFDERIDGHPRSLLRGHFSGAGLQPSRHTCSLQMRVYYCE